MHTGLDSLSTWVYNCTVASALLCVKLADDWETGLLMNYPSLGRFLRQSHVTDWPLNLFNGCG